MLNELKQDVKNKMKKTITSLQNDLSKLRTGRAHASLLDHVKIRAYGNESMLSHVSSVTVSDARTLTVTPWDKSLLQDIEKAILNSDLGLNPINLGTSLKIPMPPLTEERRKEMIKVVKNEAENARIAIRNTRRDSNNHLKDLVKAKSITEDDERRGHEEIQHLTDEHIKLIDQMVKDKEKELLEV